MKSIKLNDSLSLPVLGFGTWQLSGDDCYNSVVKAFETGYRHIDTADGYGNHLEVARAIKQSGLKREEFFLTTKIRRDDLNAETVEANVKRFLAELEIPYIDLLLIHWPNRNIPIEETLGAMNKLKEQGLIRAVGVSNFTVHHLEDALKTGIEFTNNQIELRPSFNQKELRDFCREKGITVTSYSTIKAGMDFEIPVIKELAQKYGKTEGQIILNWAVSQDIIVIPRSTKPERISENFAAPEFEMEPEDIDKINNVPQGERQTHPEWNEFDY